MSKSKSLKSEDWIRKCIKIGDERYSAFRSDPLRHNVINVAAFALLLAGLATVFSLGKSIQWQAYFLPAALCFGILSFSLQILVVHEASHNMFVIFKNRKLAAKVNQFFGTLICIFYSMDYEIFWRKGHTTHHAKPLTSIDPQNCETNNLTGSELVKAVTQTLINPIYALESFNSCRKDESRFRKTAFLLISITLWSGIFLLGYLTHNLAGAFAAAYGLVVTQAFNLVKISMEHGAMTGKEENVYLKSRTSFFWLREILMPFNISLHFEHHLNCRVPWYNLISYHRAIQKEIPENIKPYIYNFHDVTLQLFSKKSAVPQDFYLKDEDLEDISMAS